MRVGDRFPRRNLAADRLHVTCSVCYSQRQHRNNKRKARPMINFTLTACAMCCGTCVPAWHAEELTDGWDWNNVLCDDLKDIGGDNMLLVLKRVRDGVRGWNRESTLGFTADGLVVATRLVPWQEWKGNTGRVVFEVPGSASTREMVLAVLASMFVAG